MATHHTRKTFQICNDKGLHARAATLFVKTASQFQSDIQVFRGSTKANGKSIMSLLILAAPKGSEIEIEASGEDALTAVEALGELVCNGFGE